MRLQSLPLGSMEGWGPTSNCPWHSSSRATPGSSGGPLGQWSSVLQCQAGNGAAAVNSRPLRKTLWRWHDCWLGTPPLESEHPDWSLGTATNDAPGWRRAQAQAQLLGTELLLHLCIFLGWAQSWERTWAPTSRPSHLDLPPCAVNCPPRRRSPLPPCSLHAPDTLGRELRSLCCCL